MFVTVLPREQAHSFALPAVTQSFPYHVRGDAALSGLRHNTVSWATA